MRKYPNFKKFVLVIAINEINEHTDIYIPINTKDLKDESWKKLQCGNLRKITHLNFEFKVKSAKTKETTIEAPIDDEIVFTEKIPSEAFEIADINEIKGFELMKIFRRFQEWEKSKGEKRDFVKFLIDGMKNGFIR